MKKANFSLAVFAALCCGFVTTGLAQGVVVGPGPITTWVQDTLRPYVTQQLAVAGTSTAAAASGQSPTNDVIDRSRMIGGTRVAPFHVARANPPSQAPSALTVDPGVEQSARAALRQRLHREPTISEVQVEVAAFDQRIQQINRTLAARTSEFALEMARDGQFPRALEANILGFRPPDPAAGTAAMNTAINQLIHQLIVGPPQIP